MSKDGWNNCKKCGKRIACEVLCSDCACGFCYEREQFTHGEVKREYSSEWGRMISVCRKHSFERVEVEHVIEPGDLSDS